MPRAIELIVDGYVRLGDRDALERLSVHRRHLLDSVKSHSGLDLRRTIRDLEDEIEIIGKGLSKLEATADPDRI